MSTILANICNGHEIENTVSPVIVWEFPKDDVLKEHQFLCMSTSLFSLSQSQGVNIIMFLFFIECKVIIELNV